MLTMLNGWKRRKQDPGGDSAGEPAVATAAAAPEPLQAKESAGAASVTAAPTFVDLPLSEFLPQFPRELLSSEKLDPSTRVRVATADLARCLREGRTTTTAAEIFRQAPQIFRSNVPPSDEIEIRYPWQTILRMIRPAEGTSGPSPLLMQLLESLQAPAEPAAPAPRKSILRARNPRGGDGSASWFSAQKEGKAAGAAAASAHPPRANKQVIPLTARTTPPVAVALPPTEASAPPIPAPLQPDLELRMAAASKPELPSEPMPDLAPLPELTLTLVANLPAQSPLPAAAAPTAAPMPDLVLALEPAEPMPAPPGLDLAPLEPPISSTATADANPLSVQMPDLAFETEPQLPVGSVEAVDAKPAAAAESIDGAAFPDLCFAEEPTPTAADEPKPATPVDTAEIRVREVTAQWQAERAALEAKLAAAERDRATAVHETATQRDARIAELTAASERLLHERSELEREHANRLSDITAHHERALAAAREKQAAECERLSAERDSAAGRTAELERRTGELQAAHASALAALREEHAAELAKLRESFAADDLSRAGAGERNLAELAEALTLSERRLAEIEATSRVEREHYEKQLAELKASHERELADAALVLRETTAAIDAERDVFARKAEEFERLRTDQERAVAEAQSQRDAAVALAEEKGAAMAALQDENGRLEESFQLARAETDRNVRDLVDLGDTAIRRLEEEKAQAAAEAATREARLQEEHSAALAARDAELAELKAALECNAAGAFQVEAMQRVIDELQSDIDSYRGRIKLVLKQRDDLAAENRALTAELAAARMAPANVQ